MWGKWRNVTSLYAMLQESGFFKPLMWEKLDYGTFHMLDLQLKGKQAELIQQQGPTVICGANSIVFNSMVPRLYLPSVCWLKLHVMAKWLLAEQWPSSLQLSFKGHRALQLNNRLMSAEDFSHKNQGTSLTLWFSHNGHQDSRWINPCSTLPKRPLNYYSQREEDCEFTFSGKRLGWPTCILHL